MIAGRGHEAGPGLHQAPGQQQALAHRIQSVGLPGPGRFLGEIEGGSHARSQDHVPGLLQEGIHAGMLQALHPMAVVPVHGLEKGSAVVHHRRHERLGQTQVGDPVVFLGGIRNGHGRIVRTQEGRLEVVLVLGALLPARRNHVGRHVVPRPQLLGHDRPQGRELHGGVVQVSGGGVVHRLGMVVAEGLDGADDGQLVHPLGQLGKQLRNLNAGHVGGNGTEGTVGLGIPGVHLAGTAVQPDQNAGLGFPRVGAGRIGQGRFQPQCLAQVNPQKPQRPDTDELPPVPLFTGSR